MKRIIFTIAICSLSTANASYINNISQKALDQSHKVNASKSELKIKKHEYYQEIGNYLPSVELKLDHGYEYTRKFNANANDLELRLTKQVRNSKLSQLIFDGGKTIFDINRSLLAYKIKELDHESTKQQELKNFMTTYTQAFTTYKEVQILKKLVEASDEYYDQEKKMKNSGISVQEDLANSLKYKHKNLVRLQKAQNSLGDLRRKLYTYTYDRNVKLYQPKINQFKLTQSPNIKLLLKSNISHLTNKLKIDRDKKELYSYKASLLSPSVEAKASHNLDKNPSRTPGYQRTKYVGLTASYKILSGGTKYHEYMASRSKLEQTKQTYKSELQSLKQSLTLLYNDFKLSRDEYTYNTQIESEFKLLNDSTLKSFKSGVSSPKDLYATKSSYFESKIDRLNSYQNMVLQYLDLMQLYGKINFNSIR